jgi:hypothetical protein
MNMGKIKFIYWGLCFDAMRSWTENWSVLFAKSNWWNENNSSFEKIANSTEYVSFDKFSFFNF